MVLLAAVFPAGRCLAATKLPASCGPDEERFDVKTDKNQPPAGTLEAGKALVYLIGDGNGVTLRIGLNGAWIGADRGASYFFFPVDAGEHHLCANWQSSLGRFSKQVSLNKFTAEAGKIYYFRVRLDTSVGNSDSLSWLDLEPVNSDEGEYLVSVLAFSSFRKRT